MGGVKAECLMFDGKAGGICRRHAPGLGGVWPVVAAEEWCGEFQDTNPGHTAKRESCEHCRFYLHQFDAEAPKD